MRISESLAAQLLVEIELDEDMGNERFARITAVHILHDEWNWTIRQIGEAMEISKSQVQRMLHEWKVKNPTYETPAV